MIRIGAIASVEAADSFAQNRPCGLEKVAMKAVSGAALVVVSWMVQNASFQARMMFKQHGRGDARHRHRRQHIAMISFHSEAPSMRAASRISPGISRK